MSAAKQNWPRVKLGELGTMVRGCGIKRCETSPTGLPCLRYGEIYTSYEFILDKPRSFVSRETFDRSVHIKKGDLVLTLTGETQDEIAKTLAYLGDEEIAAGGDLAVWSGHGCDPRYLAYLMYTPELIKAKALASNGQIIVHISVKKIQQIEIPLPPLPVQREIVARLERELGAVDELAKKFEELEQTAEAEFKAELAEEMGRLGQMGQLGRDAAGADIPGVADVPLTPTRWAKLGEIGQIVTGSTPAKIHAEYYGKDFPLFKPTDLNQGALTTSASDSLSKQGWAVARQLPKDSVLVTCIGATLGKAGIIRREGSCNQQINAILCEKVLPEFAYYWIVSPAFQGLLWEGSHSTTLPIVNKSDFSKKPIPLPPLPTQRAIVARLDAAKARKEALVSAAKRGREAAAVWRKAILKEAFE